LSDGDESGSGTAGSAGGNANSSSSASKLSSSAASTGGGSKAGAEKGQGKAASSPAAASSGSASSGKRKKRRRGLSGLLSSLGRRIELAMGLKTNHGGRFIVTSYPPHAGQKRELDCKVCVYYNTTVSNTTVGLF
jgi:hypothetical protein